MICPKCGKDVGDYKYCPDCAVPTIQVEEHTAPNDSMSQKNGSSIPSQRTKKSFEINRFFAIVIGLHIVFCIIAFFLLLLYYKEVSGGVLLMTVIVLQMIGSVGCLVFSRQIRFWMMFPYALTGFLVALSMVFISKQLDGCLLIMFWPIMLFGVISAILAPISKIPHKENA